MRFVALLFALLVSCAANAQIPITGAGKGAPGGGGGFTPSCSQSTAFLGRATGITLNADKTNYDNLICGLNTDGVLAKLDILYVFAAPDQTTALLNLISTSFTGTTSGTVSFSAYHGFTGNASTFYINTGFTPSTAGGNFSLNSASLFAYDLTANAAEVVVVIGGFNTNQTTLGLQPGFGQVSVRINHGATNTNIGIANSQGFFVGNTTSALVGASKNGGALSTIATSPVGLDNGIVLVFADGPPGSPASFTSDQLSAAGLGGSLTNTDVSNLSSRINTFMTAYGINVY